MPENTFRWKFQRKLQDISEELLDVLRKFLQGLLRKCFKELLRLFLWEILSEFLQRFFKILHREFFRVFLTNLSKNSFKHFIGNCTRHYISYFLHSNLLGFSHKKNLEHQFLKLLQQLSTNFSVHFSRNSPEKSSFWIILAFFHFKEFDGVTSDVTQVITLGIPVRNYSKNSSRNSEGFILRKQ